MNKILVVNINWLGDAIFSTPVFAALKEAYPEARISCLCVPRVREVLRHCPHIDEILVYDEKGEDRWPWKKLALINRLRRRRFDAAFIMHRSMTRALFCFLAGIPQRIGYGKFKGLLTKHVVAKEGVHRRDHYLSVLEAVGIVPRMRVCQLRLAAADINTIELRLKKLGIGQFVVLNVGGNWDLKRWPLTAWSELARLIDSQSDLKIIFSGSLKDTADAREAIGLSKVKAFDFTGQTSLGESLALFRRAAVVVSADSGPLHLANSVGAKVVGIFGPTRPEITGPVGSGEAAVLFKDVGCNKAPCYHLSCRSNVCMQAVGVDDVFQAVQKFAG